MKRIVIVEDEYLVIEGLKKLINWEKYDSQVVGCATNGVEGLELILEKKPDVVFTDIKMPMMNGLSMIDRAKQAGCESIFIIFSGYNEFSYAREALSLGVISYIEKPVTIEQIESTMEKVGSILEKRNAARGTDSADETDHNWSATESTSAKQLSSNTARMRLCIQKGDKDALAEGIEEHFAILIKGNASSSVCAHECLRLLYMALAELGEDENNFVMEVMEGTPPYIEVGKISGMDELRTWITRRLNEVLEWMHHHSHSQIHSSVALAIEYINAHYTEPITLQQLADVVHINSTYLSTLFKKEMGISYVKYLTDLRLIEARRRLMNGERVGIVCCEVGFRDGRHFAKLYKEKFGVTPEKVKNRKD